MMAGLLIDPLADAVPEDEKAENRVGAVRLYLYQQFSPRPLADELARCDFSAMGFDVEPEQQDSGDSTLVETTLILRPADGQDGWPPSVIVPRLGKIFSELADLSPCVDLLSVEEAGRP